jgi:hypothetical protein
MHGQPHADDADAKFQTYRFRRLAESSYPQRLLIPVLFLCQIVWPGRACKADLQRTS